MLYDMFLKSEKYIKKFHKNCILLTRNVLNIFEHMNAFFVKSKLNYFETILRSMFKKVPTVVTKWKTKIGAK